MSEQKQPPIVTQRRLYAALHAGDIAIIRDRFGYQHDMALNVLYRCGGTIDGVDVMRERWSAENPFGTSTALTFPAWLRRQQLETL